MKKSITTLALCVLCAFACNYGFAQTFPYGINYQAVARDANGNAMPGPINLRLSIIPTAATNTTNPVWQEIPNTQPIANHMGQFNYTIGTGVRQPISTVTTFSNISWATDKYFLLVEIETGISIYTPIGTPQQFQAVPYAMYSMATNLKVPTVQTFTASTGTYTTHVGVLYLKIRMVGGGGGGGGLGATGGGNGGNTTFGSLTANGGIGGCGSSSGCQGPGGAGGTASGGTIANIKGGYGCGGTNQAANVATNPAGGGGGSTPFGGSGGYYGSTNSGAGGAGGSGNGATSSNQPAGAGGGGGGYIETVISPTALQTFSYSIGTSGSAGSPGPGGSGGYPGGSGVVIVEEYYQ